MRDPLALLCALVAAPSPGLAQNPPAQPPPAQTTPTQNSPTQGAVAEASTPLAGRVADVAAYLGGKGAYETLFAPAFRAQVPQAQFDAITAQLRSGLGAVTGVESSVPDGPWQATVRLGFDRGIATMRIVVDPVAPHRVTGLLVTGTEPRGDSLDAVDAEFARMAGKAGFAVHALGDGDPRLVRGQDADVAAPVGSAFKLWVLAEAARQVAAGERRWGDVVPLGARSLPSGITQDWPAGSPMTLHSLATLMIAISDNTATDTLLATLGRDRVDAMARRLAPDGAIRTLPVLTTREAFQLKSPAQAELAARWHQLSPDARRQALADRKQAFAATAPDVGMFGSRPVALDIEWYASPRDMARTLDWLRREGGSEALAILAVNSSGVSDKRLSYAGSKGGSEPGVIALNWLVRRQDGQWFAVTGNAWNPADAVDEKQFQSLMLRAVRNGIVD